MKLRVVCALALFAACKDSSQRAPAVSATPAAIEIHRAWVFRGGASVEPSGVAELVAIELTHRAMSTVDVRIADAQGNVFDSVYQWVKVDELGAPVDRIGGYYGATARVALISAVPKGTREVDLLIRGMATRRVHIEEDGPTWPPMPAYSVLKWATNQAKNGVFLLVRSTDVLEAEPHAPMIQAPGAEKGVVAIRQSATKVVVADGHGEPTEKSDDLYVAYYPWKEPAPPNEYACPTGWCPLGKPAEWIMSDALFEALNQSTRR